VSATSRRHLLRDGLVLMILVDLSAGFALLANQLLGMPAGWSWASGALLALPTAGRLHRWAEGVLSGRTQSVETLFLGEKIP
jgi:hypothetical protein